MVVSVLAKDAEFDPNANKKNEYKDWFSLAVGASYNNASSSWEWTDGSEMRYTNWHNGDYGRVDGCAYMRLPPPGVGTWLKMSCTHDGMGDWMILCERASFDV